MARDCRIELALEISKHLPDVSLGRLNGYVDAVMDTYAESARALGLDMTGGDIQTFMSVLSAQDRKAVAKLTREKIGQKNAEQFLRVVRTQEAASRSFLDIAQQLVQAASRDNLSDRPGQMAEVGKANAVKAFREHMLHRGSKLLDRNLKMFAAQAMSVIDQTPVLKSMLEGVPGTEAHAAYERFMDDVTLHMFDQRLASPDFKPETPAQRVAQAIRSGYDGSLELMNDLGLNIRRSDVYVPNYHDAARMIAAGEEAWLASVMKNIDTERSPLVKELSPKKGQSRDDALREALVAIYRGWTDRFEADAPKEAGEDVFSGVNDSAHFKFELGRDIVFKDGAAWRDYHADFGKTMDPLKGFMSDMSRRARAAAMFEIFGPHPALGAQLVKSELLGALQRAVDKSPDGFVLDIPSASHDIARLLEFNPDPAQRLEAVKAMDFVSPKDGGLTMALAEIAGDTFNSKDKSLSDTWSVVRAVKSWSALGGAAISSIADTQNIVLSMMTKGMAYKSALAGMLTEYAQHAQMRHGGLRKAIQAAGGDVSKMGDALDDWPLLSAAFEGLMPSLYSAAHADNPLSVTRLNDWFYRATGLTSSTDMNRGVAWRLNMQWLGQNAHKGFDDLPLRLQYSLGYQGIGRAQWEASRRAIAQLPNGKVYFVPELIGTLDADTLRTALNLDDTPLHMPEDIARAARPTQARWKADVEGFRRDLVRNMVGFLSDEAKSAVVEGDARTRYALLRGTNPGTIGGEFLRALAMFRSFPMGVMSSVMRQARNLPPGENIGWDAAKWIASSIVMGYASQWMLDIAQGYTPRNIVGEGAGRAFMGAFRKSSFMGPYGDALLNIVDGPKSRPWVVNAINAAGGPMVSTGVDVVDLIYRGVQADEAWAFRAFKLINQNTPGQNIWWARAALDVAVVRNVENMLDAPSRHARIRFNEEKVGREFMLPE